MDGRTWLRRSALLDSRLVNGSFWPTPVPSEIEFSQLRSGRFRAQSGKGVGTKGLATVSGEYSLQSGRYGDIFLGSSRRLNVAESRHPSCSRYDWKQDVYASSTLRYCCSCRRLQWKRRHHSVGHRVGFRGSRIKSVRVGRYLTRGKRTDTDHCGHRGATVNLRYQNRRLFSCCMWRRDWRNRRARDSQRQPAER